MSDIFCNKFLLKCEVIFEQFKLEECLYKVLVQVGFGLCCVLEQCIVEGLVKVNGEVVQIGMLVKSGDRIELDGCGFVVIVLVELLCVLVYNKLEGQVIICEDFEGCLIVFELLLLLKGVCWIVIGCLDINIIGLLLVIIDGELVNVMMYLLFEVECEYVVCVCVLEGEEKVFDVIVDCFGCGVVLEDGLVKFDEIECIGGIDFYDWFCVVVKEGCNCEVCCLWELQGCQVSCLKCICYGKVSLLCELVCGYLVELGIVQVEVLCVQLKLEEGVLLVLMLQLVIGQCCVVKIIVCVCEGGRGNVYVNGYNIVDEGCELCCFDNVCEDRGCGRGGKGGGFKGGLMVSGEVVVKQLQKLFKQCVQKNDCLLLEGNLVVFCIWYVFDGVSIGLSGYCNVGLGVCGLGVCGLGVGGQGCLYGKLKGLGVGVGGGQGCGGFGGEGCGGVGGQGWLVGVGNCLQGQGNKYLYGYLGNVLSFLFDYVILGFNLYGSLKLVCGVCLGGCGLGGGNCGLGGNCGFGGLGGNCGLGGFGGNRGFGGLCCSGLCGG